jgi:hypothetical protein
MPGGERLGTLPVAGGDRHQAMTGGVGGTDDGELGDACRAEDPDAQGVHLISSSRRLIARSPEW